MAKSSGLTAQAMLKMNLNGISQTQIAKATGVSRQAVQKRLKPLLSKIPGYEQMKDYQMNNADVLDAISAGIAGSLTTKDYKRASLLSRVNSMAALIDRSRLIRGQSTSNSVSVLLARHVHINIPAPNDKDIIELNDDL